MREQEMIKAVGQVVRRVQDDVLSRFEDFRGDATAEIERIKGKVDEIKNLASIDVRAPGIRERVVVARYTDGTEEEVGRWKEPLPVHRGVWDAELGYEQGDEVAKDGATWRCDVERAQGAEPGRSAAWVLVSKQGKTGRPGPQGEPGAPGRAGADADPLTAVKMLLRAVNKEMKERFDE